MQVSIAARGCNCLGRLQEILNGLVSGPGIATPCGRPGQAGYHQLVIGIQRRPYVFPHLRCSHVRTEQPGGALNLEGRAALFDAFLNPGIILTGRVQIVGYLKFVHFFVSTRDRPRSWAPRPATPTARKTDATLDFRRYGGIRWLWDTSSSTGTLPWVTGYVRENSALFPLARKVGAVHPYHGKEFQTRRVFIAGVYAPAVSVVNDARLTWHRPRSRYFVLRLPKSFRWGAERAGLWAAKHGHAVQPRPRRKKSLRLVAVARCKPAAGG